MRRFVWISSLLVAGAISAEGATARAQPAPDAAASEARQHFAQGEALFRRNNYDAALAEFERAYELGATNPNRYVVLFNIAQCHERMFRYDLALRYYGRYLTEGGPSAPNRAAVEATVGALEGLLATLRVAVNVPRAEVWVDGRRVGDAPGPVRVPGGRHLVEVRAPGHSPARQEVQVAARDTRDVRLTLEALGRSRGISPVFFWSAAGAAVVAAGVGVAFGLGVASARSDVDARLADPAQRFLVTEQDREDIQRRALTADVFFGTAAVLAVGAGVLFFLTEWRREAPPPAAAPRARLAPLLGPGAAGLALGGSF